MKTLVPPAEICKRRGITLAPIITKCFDETASSLELPQAIQIHRTTYIDTGQIQSLVNLDADYLDDSRWSSTSTESGSLYSETVPETELNNHEPYEQQLYRNRCFFNNRPLMRCLDNESDQLFADLLFERLLREVQQPGLPFDKPTGESRGEVQVCAFWDDVRKELEFDESFLEYEWQERNPQVSPDGVGESLPQGGCRKFRGRSMWFGLR